MVGVLRHPTQAPQRQLKAKISSVSAIPSESDLPGDLIGDRLQCGPI